MAALFAVLAALAFAFGTVLQQRGALDNGRLLPAIVGLALAVVGVGLLATPTDDATVSTNQRPG